MLIPSGGQISSLAAPLILTLRPVNSSRGNVEEPQSHDHSTLPEAEPQLTWAGLPEGPCKEGQLLKCRLDLLCGSLSDEAVPQGGLFWDSPLVNEERKTSPREVAWAQGTWLCQISRVSWVKGAKQTTCTSPHLSSLSQENLAHHDPRDFCK